MDDQHNDLSNYPKPGASPQAENGHVDIANEIVEALAKTNLSAYESRILWALWRKTYGWHKKEDRISITQFQKLTGLQRRHVSRSLCKLVQRNIVTKRGDTFILTYGFQKDYTKWKGCHPKRNTITRRGDGVSPELVTSLSPKEVLTKEIFTKETLTKESEYSSSKPETRSFDLARLLFQKIRARRPDFQPSFSEIDLNRWAKDIDLMIRADKRDPKRIAEVIVWAQADPFWCGNTLSGAEIRKKFDRLVDDMNYKHGHKKKGATHWGAKQAIEDARLRRLQQERDSQNK